MKTVRLPIFGDDGTQLHEHLEVSVYILERLAATSVIYKDHVRVVETPAEDKVDVAAAEIELVDRIISGLSNPEVEWRPLEDFPGYKMNTNAVIYDADDKRVEILDTGRRARPSVMLYLANHPKRMDVAILFKRTFPELVS